ncbi:MAG: hypothetical protein BJ554DRAFT_3640, partial [Olpidium bornovanus]
MLFARRNSGARGALAGMAAIVLAHAAAASASLHSSAWTANAPTGHRLEWIAALSNHSKLSVPDGELLAPLLVPRVAGTPGNAKVRAFIADHFRKLGWAVQLDNFTDATPPAGATVEFANVIATKAPGAKKRLVLAAHYDSKYFPPPDEDKFIGATDSAVPCAILLDLAATLNDLLDARAVDRTLQMIFFDGEEAFVEHLAAKWGSTFVAPDDSAQFGSDSLLDSIEVFVLLDLLGARSPSILNMQPLTTHYYQALNETELSLAAAGLLATHVSATGNVTTAGVADRRIGGKKYEPCFKIGSPISIEDDHVPFANKGVSVVHIINFPFPPEWHKLTVSNDFFLAHL